MALSKFFKRNAERGLLAPLENVTLIDRDKYNDLGRYISVGDRVAWLRPYLMIHEAIVLHVNGKLAEMWVMERTVDGVTGKSKVSKKTVKSEIGDLYVYNEKSDESAVYQQLKAILLKLDKKGYNPLVLNCQNFASTAHGGSGGSYQAYWLAIVTLFKGFGIPAISELIEGLSGGYEVIGCISSAVLHAMALVADIYLVCNKRDRTNMTKTEFISLITRQVLLGLFQWFGNVLSSFPAFLTGPCGRSIVILVLILFGVILFDAFMLWLGMNPESNWRYLTMALGSIIGLAIGVTSVGCLFEFLLSMILGFIGAFIANGLHHAGSWLIGWLTSKKVEGEWLKDMEKLQEGDHITTYAGCHHPYCHAIFYKCSTGTSMKVFRNTEKRGVVKEEVEFQKNWVYLYNYPPNDVRKRKDVIAEAKSKLKEPNQYSLLTYNCKTFAEQCKRNLVDNVEGKFDPKAFLKEVSKDKNLERDQKKQLKKAVNELHKLMKGEEHRSRRPRSTRLLRFKIRRSRDAKANDE